MIAWQAGDWPDRKAILAIGAATILSAVSFELIGGSFRIVLVGVIDVTLLAIIVRYALRSSRYWPIWFAGFHGLGMTLNLLRLVVPENYAAVFQLITGLCGIAALAAMMFGLLADKKRGVGKNSA